MSKKDLSDVIAGWAEVDQLIFGWSSLTESLLGNEFDYADFRDICVRTFAFLHPYSTEDNLPREVVDVLLNIKAFASCPIRASRKSECAKAVAEEFCSQMVDCWVEIDGQIDKNQFAVVDDGEEYILDANTFDLSEMLYHFCRARCDII